MQMSGPLLWPENSSVQVASQRDTKIPIPAYRLSPRATSGWGRVQALCSRLVPELKPCVEVSWTISSHYLSTSHTSQAPTSPKRWCSMSQLPALVAGDRSGRVSALACCVHIRVFLIALCIAPHPGQICHGKPYQAATTPWQHTVAAGIPETRKLLHHDKVAMHCTKKMYIVFYMEI